MSSTSEISSLAQIKERKVEIQQEIERSQKGALKKLKTTASETKSFVVEDVLLPAVGIAAGAYLLTMIVKYAFREQPSSPTSMVAQSSTTIHPVPDEDKYYAEGNATAANTRVIRQTPVTAPESAPPTPPSTRTASLLRLGTLLIPAGKAIVNAIQSEGK